MSVYYLIYESKEMRADLMERCEDRWVPVLENSTLGRIKNGPLKEWIYPDEPSGWPGFFEELFRVSGQTSAEIYFSGTNEEIEALGGAAEIFMNKSGKEIAIRSAKEESLKERKKLYRALYDYCEYGDHKAIYEVETVLKTFFTEVIKQINDIYAAESGTDDFLHNPDIREGYLDDIIEVFYRFCDCAANEFTLAYDNVWDKILLENYAEDVLFSEKEISSWKFIRPEMFPMLPEQIKEYLETDAGHDHDEIAEKMTEMYEYKIMQCIRLLNDQIRYLGALIKGVI